MRDDDDLARWLARTSAAMGVPQTTAAELAERLRAEWGGARVYVRKRESAAGKAQALGVAIAQGTSIRAAVEALGVSQRTAYRLLGRSWVKGW
jgi:hypothetical protein